jgi:S-DNA-T family DNA segregation ATPase FtsK/SpoIIIE
MRHLSSFLKSATFFLLFLLVFLSLHSFDSRDISYITFPPSESISNLIGIAGAYLGFFLLFIFGYAAYFLPFCFFFLALDNLGLIRFSGLGRSKVVNVLSFLFFSVFLAAFIGLFSKEHTDIFKSSGMVGFFLADFFEKYLGIYGAFITIFLLMTVNAVLLFGLFFVDFFKLLKDILVGLVRFLSKIKIPKKDTVVARSKRPKLKEKPKEAPKVLPEKPKGPPPEIKVYTPKVDSREKKESLVEDKAGSLGVAGLGTKRISQDEAKKKIESLEGQEGKTFDSRTYKLPFLDLLKVPPFPDQRQLKDDIEGNIKNLENTLSDFGVEAKVVSVQKGPVVTMYELQPQSGTKIQKISSLADDIAMAMKSSSVRIVAPIPGRGTVGVEIPNITKHLVFLREVLEEKIFNNSSSKLTLVIGKDVSGNPVIADLKEMPHLLIAGTTGAGKTVCVNSLISSILFKAKPDEVKFIMVDPKMVELASFAGIPHLIHPIISEAKKAFFALNWAVEEMEKRYKLLAAEGCRNIEAYNKNSKKLPYIVIIIDELADLMIVARESIETAIQRLAQLSRAVGIHLILATQRPSVDVITGVIKANFPARISFKVSAKVDSRTVLDMMGADKLLGKGDLLFLKPGAVKLIRAQGSFIDDEDIESLTDFIREQGKPIYEEAIAEGEKKHALDLGSDELFDEALKIILRTRQASASMLQRRLRVGYTRAARLLDLMEQKGIVGPFCGSKARDILVDPEGFLTEKGLV